MSKAAPSDFGGSSLPNAKVFAATTGSANGTGAPQQSGAGGEREELERLRAQNERLVKRIVRMEEYGPQLNIEVSEQLIGAHNALSHVLPEPEGLVAKAIRAANTIRDARTENWILRTALVAAGVKPFASEPRPSPSAEVSDGGPLTHESFAAQSRRSLH